MKRTGVTIMEQWQIDIVSKLLDTQTKEVEPGTRVYLSSQAYGDSRYHMVNKKYDGVQIEQTVVDDKWGSRVNLSDDELPGLLKTLLLWYFEAERKQQEYNKQQSAALGDLDDHPF
jgi:hypothetical protein